MLKLPEQYARMPSDLCRLFSEGGLDGSTDDGHEGRPMLILEGDSLGITNLRSFAFISLVAFGLATGSEEIWRRKKRVERLDKLWRGATRRAQGEDRLYGLAGRLTIDIDVGPAESVDGLLRISDQDQKPVVRLLVEDLPEDLHLLLVRILGFVDQAQLVGGAQVTQEFKRPRRIDAIAHAMNGAMHPDNQIIKRDGPGLRRTCPDKRRQRRLG